MLIKVIGKSHLQGKSKSSGKDYNFIVVHYLGKARNVIGQCGKSFNLNPEEYSFDAIVVGGDYNAEFDPDGYPLEFTKK